MSKPTIVLGAAGLLGLGAALYAWQEGLNMPSTISGVQQEVRIPPIDRNIPAKIETATFALG
jgi:hypothetical protein